MSSAIFVSWCFSIYICSCFWTYFWHMWYDTKKLCIPSRPAQERLHISCLTCLNISNWALGVPCCPKIVETCWDLRLFRPVMEVLHDLPEFPRALAIPPMSWGHLGLRKLRSVVVPPVESRRVHGGFCHTGSDRPDIFSWVAFESWYMEVSWNVGTPKSSILIGFSMIFHYKLTILGASLFMENFMCWHVSHCRGEQRSECSSVSSPHLHGVGPQWCCTSKDNHGKTWKTTACNR